ncbi:MAG: hypothetical protein ACK421_01150 [Pseudanabaenaceae cyanobacterium]
MVVGTLQQINLMSAPLLSLGNELGLQFLRATRVSFALTDRFLLPHPQ